MDLRDCLKGMVGYYGRCCVGVLLLLPFLLPLFLLLIELFMAEFFIVLIGIVYGLMMTPLEIMSDKITGLIFHQTRGVEVGDDLVAEYIIVLMRAFFIVGPMFLLKMAIVPLWEVSRRDMIFSDYLALFFLLPAVVSLLSFRLYRRFFSRD